MSSETDGTDGQLRIFDVLRVLDPEIVPSLCKIHLAVSTGTSDPLDEYLGGTFQDWQSYQSRKNFERPYVLSLISLPARDLWLFAGVFNAQGSTRRRKDGREYNRYSLKQRRQTVQLDGRLIVRFSRGGRQSYLRAERWSDWLYLHEIRPERMIIEDFPGYSRCCITKGKLELIARHHVSSWISALSSVSGIYLISDMSTGKLYVGKATGDGGIWGRWSAYLKNGHGGNRELQELLSDKGVDYSANFQFAVLETADTHATEEYIQAREIHWKNVLRSREFGYNRN